MKVSLLSNEVQDELKQDISIIISQSIEHFKEVNQPRYFKKFEALSYINCSNNTMDKLIKKGLPAICIDGLVRYDRIEIDRFLEKHKI